MLKRSKLLRLLLALLTAALCLFAPASRAELRESSEPLVDLITERTLERIPELPFSLPARLASDHDVYLLITLGGAIADIRLLGRTSVPPQRLARILETAAGAEPQARLFTWSKEDDYSAARFTLSQAHLGVRSAATSLALGKLVAGIRGQGLLPHVLVRVPTYTDPTPLPLPRFQLKNNVWYQGDNAPEACRITASARLSPGEVGLALFLMAGVGTVGIISLLGAFLFARADKIDFDIRRRLFLKIALWPLYAVVAVSTSIGFFYMSSQAAAVTADLWLGSTTRSSTVIFVLPNVTVFLVLVLLACLLQAKLFAEKRTETDATLSPGTAQERAVNRQIALLSLLPFGLGMALLFAKPSFPRHQHLLSSFWSMADVALFCFGPMLVRFLFRRRLKELEDETSDTALTYRAERIAQELGIRLRTVKVSNGEAAKRYASVQATQQGLVVSHKCLEVMSPEELDYVLAYTLVRSNLARRLMLTMLIPVAALCALLTSLTFGGIHVNSEWKLPLIFGVYIGMLPAVAGMSVWFHRREAYRASRRVLQMTSNLEAALSADRKLAEYGAMMEMDATRLEQARARHRAVLQRAAHDLGIVETA